MAALWRRKVGAVVGACADEWETRGEDNQLVSAGSGRSHNRRLGDGGGGQSEAVEMEEEKNAESSIHGGYC